MKKHSQTTLALLGSSLTAIALLGTPAHAAIYVLDSAYYNGHTYYLLDNSNWSDAESAAVNLGGHLVTINDANENSWVYNNWGAAKDLWIGLYDPVTNDGGGAQHAANFQWVDGSSSTYRNWISGEPNSVNGGEYYGDINAGQGGGWNDTRNYASLPGSVYYGVVEVVPEPSSAALFLIGSLGLGVFKRYRK